MTMPKILILGLIALIIFAISLGDARANFIPVDDFDTLTPGPIDGQNGWYASDLSSEITYDPAVPENLVLAVHTASTFLFHSAVIPEGQARTLFMRFRYEDQLNISFGMSESSFPDQFGNFEPELSLTSTNDDLRINDGGTYSVLTSLESEHWYNCWLHIDNNADVTSVWVHDRYLESATSEDKLEIDGRYEIPFRQGTLNNLQNFFIKTGGGAGVSGPLILDDIYLQDSEGLDLSYPEPAVAGVARHPFPMQLHGANPNPFNPQTTISFTLDEPQSIELAVYDLGGRQLVLLSNGSWEAGLHSVTWSGCDQAGKAMASGVYFINLKSPKGIQSVKIALVQ